MLPNFRGFLRVASCVPRRAALRYLLDAHWPSDVVATLFLGIGEALLLLCFFELIWKIVARRWMPDVFARHPSLLGDFDGRARLPGAPQQIA